MSGDQYYDHSAFPANGSLGLASSMRAELDKIETAFGKLPTLALASAGRPITFDLTGMAFAVMTAFPDITDYNVSLTAPGLVPKLPGGTTTFLRGDGTFGPQGVSSFPAFDRTTNTALTSADSMKIFNFTGSTSFSQTFNLNVLTSGVFIRLQNLGTADIEVVAPVSVTTTSTTSNSIAAGVTWTVGTGLAISVGHYMIARRTADSYAQRITGTVSAYNSGTGSITITPMHRVGSGTFTDWTITTGANGIDGLPSYVMYPRETRDFYINASTALVSTVVHKYYRKAIAGFVHIAPPGYIGTDLDMVGGSGGAGSGRKGAVGSVRNGGSPGGTPARIRKRVLLTVGAATTASIGAAGVSGAAQATDSTNGNSGTDGGNTTFGSYATAYGGVGGVGGDTSTNFGLTSGSGSQGKGSSSWVAINTAVIGGNPCSYNATVGVAGLPTHATHEEGGASGINVQPGNSIHGGASAASNNIGNLPPGGGKSIFGVAAGGWGAGVTTGEGTTSGGQAGKTGGWNVSGASGGTSGASPTAGGNGDASTADNEMGNPGAGGGSTATADVNGGAGGNGSFPGGPGGGGGACTNGTGSSGAGGTSQAGQMIIEGVVG